MMRSTIMLALVMALTIALYAIDIGEALDNRFGDFVMKQRGIRSSDAPVVYLRLDDATLAQTAKLPWSTATAQRVFDKLHENGAKKVVLAASQGMVLQDPQALRSEPWLLIPYWRGHGSTPKPMQITLPDPDGITRKLYSWHPASEVGGYAWQYEVLQRQPNTESVHINFVGPPNSIGNLSLVDVLSDASPRNFLEGKIAVIGVDLPDLTRTINVPVSDFFHPMAEGEFHAQALITLLEGNEINAPNVWWMVGGLFVLMIMLWLLMLRATIGTNIILTIVFLIAAQVLAVVVFLSANLLLPISGMVAIIGLTFLASAERKARLLRKRTQEIANNSSWELTLRPITQGVNGAKLDKIWERLTAFAAMNLKPTSMLLALPDKSGGRIRFSHFYACSENDVQEKRRDVSRLPYAAAIDNTETQQISGFMKENGDSYIVPLFYPANLTGIWIVNTPSNGDSEYTRNSLNLIGRQIARQLYYSQRPANGSRRRKSPLDPLQRQLESIDRIFGNLLEEKIAYLSIINSVGVGLAYADIFGRVLHLNRPLQAEMKQRKIRPESLRSVQELLEALGAPSSRADNWVIRVGSESEDTRFETSTHEMTLKIVNRAVERDRKLPEGYLLIVTPKQTGDTANGNES